MIYLDPDGARHSVGTLTFSGCAVFHWHSSKEMAQLDLFAFMTPFSDSIFPGSVS
ncbi:MAG: hypothetical protein GWP38_06980 [Planctomycetia bacterium]|nr:hypothetical protein [Planctomycetia bacterium]